MKPKAPVVLTVLLLWSGYAAADPAARVEVGAFVGNEQSGDVELGNAFYEDQIPGDSVLFGARARLRLIGGLGLEVEAQLAPKTTPGNAAEMRSGVSASVLGVRAQATYDLFSWWRVEPFVTAGAGTETVWFSAPVDYLVERDTDMIVHWGVGARVAIGDHFGLRFDFRQQAGPGRESTASLSHEGTAGLFYRFGGGSAPSSAVRRAAPRIAAPTTRPQRIPPTVEPIAKAALAQAPVDAPRTSIDSPLAPYIRPGVNLAVTRLAKKTETLLASNEAWAPDGGVDDEDPDADDFHEGQTAEAGTTLGIGAAIDRLKRTSFEHGSARLTRQFRRSLLVIARHMNDHPYVVILIAGHADSEGTDYANLAISRKRADYAKWFLVDQGVDPVRIETIGYAADRPAVRGNPQAGHARNRRVEIELAN